MRLFAAAFAISTCLAASIPAHADGVTFIVSEDATGTYGSQTFTNTPLTLTLSFTADQLSQAILFGYYGPNDFSFFQTPENSATLNIAGIGTFQTALAINSALEGGEIFEDDDVGDLGLQFDLTIPNFLQSVGPLTQTIGYTDPGANCVPDFHTPCPPYFYTGYTTPPVYVTSLGGTWTQEMVVNSAATPEPSTFLLLTTGLLGIGVMLWRRFTHI